MVIRNCDKHRWVKVVQTATNQPKKQWVQCANCGAMKVEKLKQKINGK